MPRLIVIAGANSGKAFEFREECTLGRSLEANVRLHDSAVSRKHARIFRKGPDYVVEDLGSGNGTLLNGVPVSRESPLREGDRLKLGHIVLQFKPDDDRAYNKPELPKVQIVDVQAGNSSTILKQIDARQSTVPALSATSSSALLALAHQRLRTVLSISNSMQRILSLDRLLPQICSDLFAVFPQADRALILMKEDSSTGLGGSVALMRDGTRLDKMEVSRTIIGEVMRTRSALLSADATVDGRFMAGASVHNLKVRSMVCAPLLGEDEIVGVIYADTTRSGRRFSEEDLELLTGIGAQAALAVQNAVMHERLLHQHRDERDLQLAHKVQKGFLPETPPNVPGYGFAAWYSSAQVVGGDFYDFIELPDKRVCIAVGDVCGKGIPAALLMAKFMSDVRYVAMAEPKPADAVARLNEIFGHRAPEGRFVTLLYAVLDPVSHRVESVNAGHPAPLIRRSSTGRIERIVAGDNFPLGVRMGYPFASQVHDLNEGDAVALFTDGVTEAMNSEGKLYGTERLARVLQKASDTPSRVMTTILNDIEGHVGAVAQSDDLTLVCFGPVAEKSGKEGGLA